jgi:hypothetical protein
LRTYVEWPKLAELGSSSTAGNLLLRSQDRTSVVDPLRPSTPRDLNGSFHGTTAVRPLVQVGGCSAFADIHVSAWVGRLEAALRTFAQPAAANVRFNTSRNVLSTLSGRSGWRVVNGGFRGAAISGARVLPVKSPTITAIRGAGNSIASELALTRKSKASAARCSHPSIK